MPSLKLERYVNAIIDLYQELFRNIFPLSELERARWSRPEALTELSVGFDREPFVRYAFGQRRGGPLEPLYLSSIGSGFELESELLQPPMPANFPDEDEDEEDSLDRWLDDWSSEQAMLQITAMGAALHYFDRHPEQLVMPTAQGCFLGVFDDVDDVQERIFVRRFGVSRTGDEQHAVALAQVVEHPRTREWLYALRQAGKGDSSLAPFEAIAERFPLEQILDRP